MKYIGFITVRSNSSRLKKKCLLNFGKYKVIEQLDDINADLKTDKHIRTYDWGSETGKFSYWLIDAFSTGGGTHFHDVNLIVELFTSDRPYNNYLRLIEIK